MTNTGACAVALPRPAACRLLNYAHSGLLFSDRRVDTNLISWNRVIMLHGPPGELLLAFKRNDRHPCR